MDQLIDRLIDLAFAEDIGDGDHTTLSCIPADAMGKSKLLIKGDGILAGVEIAKEIFHRFDPELKVTVLIGDGSEVKPGDIAMLVEGRIQSHDDTPLCRETEGHQDPRPRHPQDYSRDAHA